MRVSLYVLMYLFMHAHVNYVIQMYKSNGKSNGIINTTYNSIGISSGNVFSHDTDTEIIHESYIKNYEDMNKKFKDKKLFNSIIYIRHIVVL